MVFEGEEREDDEDDDDDDNVDDTNTKLRQRRSDHPTTVSS